MPKVCRSCCTAASCGRLCFTVTSSCAPNPGVAGATVAVSKSGVAVGTATTSSQVTATTKISGGSGYTSPPTVSFTGGGGTGAAGTVTVTFGQVGVFTLTSGGNGYTSAPTIVFTGGGGSGASFTATIGAQACIPITSSGTSGQYTYSISASGYTTKAGSLGAVTCSGTTTTSTAVQLDPSSANVTTNVTSSCIGSANALAGASVTIGTASGTSDSGGHYVASQPTAAAITVSAVLGPRFATTSSNITVLKCGNTVALGLNPAAGYQCVGCLYPASKTLVLSDTVFGGATLTWLLNTDPGNWLTRTAWVGSTTVNFPGCTTCPTPASGVTLYYAWDGTSVFMGWATPSSGATQCPCSGTGCTTGYPTSLLSTGANPADIVCPPSYHVTIAIPAQLIYCASSGATITITE